MFIYQKKTWTIYIVFPQLSEGKNQKWTFILCLYVCCYVTIRCFVLRVKTIFFVCKYRNKNDNCQMFSRKIWRFRCRREFHVGKGCTCSSSAQGARIARSRGGRIPSSRSDNRNPIRRRRPRRKTSTTRSSREDQRSRTHHPNGSRQREEK